jgi:Xaa-Pro aminopeptidase
MKQQIVKPDLFSHNRKRFIREMKPNAIAIFVSNDEWPSNGDALHTFKQNSDLYWLTGIKQEDTMLILFPDHPEQEYKEVLVLLRPNELKEKWDGKRLRMHEAQAISGIQKIIWLDAIESILQQWVHLADHIYLGSNENDRKATAIQTREYRFIQEMQAKFPLHQYHRAAKIMKMLRAIKSVQEVELIAHAIKITEQTFRKLLQKIRPGIAENEIEGFIWQSFLAQGSPGPAYGSIIASGDKARILHYTENNDQCRAGELLLMDFGAEYGGYCADLTRTVPVSGKFTRRQKTVYNACLHLHNYAKSLLKPGITILDYTNKVGEEASKVFLKIGLLRASDIKNEDMQNRAYRKYLYHGISHHLGIDVHDLGTRTEPVKAGMVFTIEPGIYIEEEKMGVRIENNVWITKSGNKDLMQSIPITADEIESCMKCR